MSNLSVGVVGAFALLFIPVKMESHLRATHP